MTERQRRIDETERWYHEKKEDLERMRLDELTKINLRYVTIEYKDLRSDTETVKMYFDQLSWAEAAGWVREWWNDQSWRKSEAKR